MSIVPNHNTSQLQFDPNSSLIRVVHAASLVKMKGVSPLLLGELGARACFGQVILVPTLKGAAATLNVSAAMIQSAAHELKARGDDVGIISREVNEMPMFIDFDSTWRMMSEAQQAEFAYSQFDSITGALEAITSY
jgi:hypothetical protein